MKKIQLQKQPALSAEAAKAMESVYANIFFAGKDLKKITLTSAENSEANIDTVWKVAMCVADHGEKVLVIDADLRYSTLAAQYGATLGPNDPGLAQYLTGRCGMDEGIYETSLKDIYLLPVGSNTANPTMLFKSPEFKTLLDACCEKFDKILVLAPGEGDMTVDIANTTDGVVLLVHDNKTSIRRLHGLKVRLSKSERPVLGCIVCGVSKMGMYADE